LGEIDGYSGMAQRSRADAREKYAWFNQRECIVAGLGLDATSA
jgi:hypothetical protein